MNRLVVGIALLAACKSKAADDPPVDPTPVVHDAAPIDAAPMWKEIAELPRVEPERVIVLPARPDVPRFDVGGPVIAGDLAIVSSSQFGFIAVDWRRGTIVWTKPAGLHVAPPLVRDSSIVLIGDCLTPPVVPDGELLLGCMRVVTGTGADEAYTAIRGKPKAVEAFAAEAGPQALWADGDRVRWRRGELAVSVDLISGVARPADVRPPPLVVTYKETRWDIRQVDGRVVASASLADPARAGSGVKAKPSWQTENEYTALLGSIWLPEHSPMLRIVNLTARGGDPQLMLIDIDATGSLRGTIGRSTPGIGILGSGVSSVGDAAIAVRMDRSLRRDFVVGYAANAMLMWVFPLPEIPRADLVGVALAPEAVVVFHDGDTVSILPELSAPPTAPGAVRAASQIPTP